MSKGNHTQTHDYVPLIHLAHERWKKDRTDTWLIDFIVKAMILEAMKEGVS